MSPYEGSFMSAKRNVLPSALATALLAVCALISIIFGDRAPDKTPTVVNKAAVTQLASSTSVAASSTPKRITAYKYAKTQQGDRYQYGGNGPNTWDCSGLVKWAYGKVGINLPRTTGDLLRDSRDQLMRTNYPRNGDLVLNDHHVELYVHYKDGVRWMFGAHHSGTRVGYAKIYSGLRYYRVRGAG